MSPRYKKPRKCNCPFDGYKGVIYKPIGIPAFELQQVIIYRDELEAMRLCDFKGLTQQTAGEKMGISRGTVQRLLASARKKVIKGIIETKAWPLKKSIIHSRSPRLRLGKRLECKGIVALSRNEITLYKSYASQ